MRSRFDCANKHTHTDDDDIAIQSSSQVRQRVFHAFLYPMILCQALYLTPQWIICLPCWYRPPPWWVRLNIHNPPPYKCHVIIRKSIHVTTLQQHASTLMFGEKDGFVLSTASKIRQPYIQNQTAKKQHWLSCQLLWNKLWKLNVNPLLLSFPDTAMQPSSHCKRLRYQPAADNDDHSNCTINNLFIATKRKCTSMCAHYTSELQRFRQPRGYN